MLDFINILFFNLGLPTVLSFGDISYALSGLQEWWQFAFDPTLVFSSLFYFLCCWGVFSLTLRLLYRVVKKIIKYPHSKGCEFK